MVRFFGRSRNWKKRSQKKLCYLCRKKYDLWRCENERDEARRLQRSGSSRRVKEEADSQDLLSLESCRSSVVDQVEWMSLGSPRKSQDVQMVISETAGKATRGRGEDAWILEPEGVTEMPETRVVSDGLESIHVDLDGEGRHVREQVKKSRRQSEAPGEEGEEIQSPKRKIIRVECEETQDYVREANDMDQEEAEEISFVPSSISVPQKPLFRCDNQCSEKTLSFWQSVVIKEGGESYATNLCQQRHNKSLEAKGNKPLTKWQWHGFVKKTAHRVKLWEIMGEKNNTYEKCGKFVAKKEQE